jgi:hypothetical protein
MVAPQAKPPEGEALVESGGGHKSGLLTHAVAGLQAGVVGVIWMFGCFVVGAVWNGRNIWSVPNLFSTVFYGDFAWQDEFLRTTWAGCALIVVIYGLLGAAWGCLWKENRRALMSFYGALTGLAIYFFFFNFAWVHADPLLPLYGPLRQLQVAHILWGAALARSPGYSRRIAAAITPAVPREANPAAAQDAAESVSGELIL